MSLTDRVAYILLTGNCGNRLIFCVGSVVVLEVPNMKNESWHMTCSCFVSPQCSNSTFILSSMWMFTLKSLTSTVLLWAIFSLCPNAKAYRLSHAKKTTRPRHGIIRSFKIRNKLRLQWSFLWHTNTRGDYNVWCTDHHASLPRHLIHLLLLTCSWKQIIIYKGFKHHE